MNNNLFRSQLSIRLFVYFTIGIVISYLIPFPYSFLLILGTVILITIYIREKVLNIMDLGMSIITTFGRRRLTYYCMTCGTQHRDIICPRCGSRIKKV
jgi:ABC-type uncharacterized transport system permease subunit